MNALTSSDYICGIQIYVNTNIHINKSSTKINKDKYYTEGQTQPFVEAAWVCLKIINCLTDLEMGCRKKLKMNNKNVYIDLLF